MRSFFYSIVNQTSRIYITIFFQVSSITILPPKQNPNRRGPNDALSFMSSSAWKGALPTDPDVGRWSWISPTLQPGAATVLVRQMLLEDVATKDL